MPTCFSSFNLYFCIPFRERNMKRERIQIGTLILGVITAVAIVLSQCFFFQHQSPSNQKEVAKSQQHQAGDQQQDNQAYISLPSTSLPSSTHVEVTQSSFFLFEILFEESTPSVSSSGVPILVDKLFHTLFRAIISPNAP